MKNKVANFGPERQAECREKAIESKEMLFDMEQGKVFFTGKHPILLGETIMSITLTDAANLATTMLSMGAQLLVETVAMGDTGPKLVGTDTTKH